MTPAFRLFFVPERIFGRPFPGRICFLDLRGALHRRWRYGLIGVTGFIVTRVSASTMSHFPGTFARMGRGPRAAEIDPLAREAVARANSK